jgi:hypothetical protein
MKGFAKPHVAYVIYLGEQREAQAAYQRAKQELSANPSGGKDISLFFYGNTKRMVADVRTFLRDVVEILGIKGEAKLLLFAGNFANDINETEHLVCAAIREILGDESPTFRIAVV